MTTTLTSRDAVLVLLIGSSNSAGNTDRTTGRLTKASLPAVDNRCKVWGRWNADPVSGRFTPGGSYDWDPITTTQNLNSSGVSPLYSLAKAYSDAVYKNDQRGRGAANINGRPQGIYFVQYSASSSRSTQDAEDVNPAASWYPKAANVSNNTAYETFVNLYLNEAITNLNADADVDRIFLDCIYVIGNESAGYASTTVFASDNTVDELIPGMAMLHSEIADRMGIDLEELVEVTVKPSLSFEKFVNASADSSRIPQVRTAYDDYAAMVNHPIAVVDGTLFDVYLRSNGVDFGTFAPLSNNTISWNDTTDEFTLTILNPAAPGFNTKYAVGDAVTFNLTATTNGATAGTGIVKSVTADTFILENVSFSAGNPEGGGDITGDQLTIGTNETNRDAQDTDFNHYTGQGVLQMGEAMYLSRLELSSPLPLVKSRVRNVDSSPLPPVGPVI